MIIDAMEDVLKKTSALPFPLPTTLLPSLTHSASHALPTGTPTGVPGVPSVLPDPIDRQFVGHNGSTTLWVVFVLMVIASAVFAAWSWTVPVVSVVHKSSPHPADSFSQNACTTS